MNTYRTSATKELNAWKKRMNRRPSFANRLTKNIQSRINNLIPEKIHTAITVAIKQMTRAVYYGAEFTSPAVLRRGSLQVRERKVDSSIKFYSRTAAAEGAVTGAGGILLGLADFPLWLVVKMKMLVEIAGLYGFDSKDYKERLYLLHIFELTFCSQEHRRKVFAKMSDWNNHVKKLPDDINQFDWRSFQLEYRDYIDLAKLFQLIPGIGAAVGAVVNHRLTSRLGEMAKNAYRMRRLPNPPKKTGVTRKRRLAKRH